MSQRVIEPKAIRFLAENGPCNMYRMSREMGHTYHAVRDNIKRMKEENILFIVRTTTHRSGLEVNQYWLTLPSVLYALSIGANPEMIRKHADEYLEIDEVDKFHFICDVAKKGGKKCVLLAHILASSDFDIRPMLITYTLASMAFMSTETTVIPNAEPQLIEDIFEVAFNYPQFNIAEKIRASQDMLTRKRGNN